MAGPPDIFLGDMRTFIGVAAAISAVGGLLMWGAGIRIARVAVALLLGLSAAGLAAWGLPGATGLAPLSAAIIGFVVGLLAGAVTFKFVQGAILAGCLALAVMGGYFHWQMGKPLPTLAATTMAAPEVLNSVVHNPNSQAANAIPGKAAAWNVARLDTVMEASASAAQNWLTEQWQALPEVHRQRMAVLAILTAVVGLLMSLAFPRYTTWISSAAVGTLLLVAALLTLLQVYAPRYLMAVPGNPLLVCGCLLAIMGVGMLMQRMVFWPRKKKAIEVVAVPVEGT